jgi:hypothetical protein
MIAKLEIIFWLTALSAFTLLGLGCVIYAAIT